MQYVALLRGINVGGNCKVDMASLRKVFASLGYTDVSTYINSGNVLFSTDHDASTLVDTIEPTLAQHFGFPIPTVIRSAKQIHALVKSIPSAYQNDPTQRTDILFLWDAYDHKKSLSLVQTNPDVDHLTYIKGSIIWNVDRTHYNKSGMHKFIGSELYKHMTARNVNTVRKLAILMQ